MNNDTWYSVSQPLQWPPSRMEIINAESGNAANAISAAATGKITKFLCVSINLCFFLPLFCLFSAFIQHSCIAMVIRSLRADAILSTNRWYNTSEKNYGVDLCEIRSPQLRAHTSSIIHEKSKFWLFKSRLDFREAVFRLTVEWLKPSTKAEFPTILLFHSCAC